MKEQRLIADVQNQEFKQILLKFKSAHCRYQDQAIRIMDLTQMFIAQGEIVIDYKILSNMYIYQVVISVCLYVCSQLRKPLTDLYQL